MNFSKITVGDDERLDKVNSSITIIQKKNGLLFGTDAYLLAAFARKGRKCAELGGGCGIVSLLTASAGKYEKIYTIEVQSEFADIIKRNSELNGYSETVISVECDVRRLELNDVGGSELDCIISNPPYLPLQCGFENAHSMMNIARREVEGTINDFCKAASKLLKHGGYFTVVYRPDRLADLIFAMKSSDIEPKRMITVYPHSNAKPCLILVEGKKGAAPSLVTSPPLLIYEDKRCIKYTEKMQRIYDEFKIDFLFDGIK